MNLILHVDMLFDRVQTSFNMLAISHNQIFQCEVRVTFTIMTEIHV